MYEGTSPRATINPTNVYSIHAPFETSHACKIGSPLRTARQQAAECPTAEIGYFAPNMEGITVTVLYSRKMVWILLSHGRAPRLLSPGDQVLSGGAEGRSAGSSVVRLERSRRERCHTRSSLRLTQKCLNKLSTEGEWGYGSLPFDVYQAQEKPNEDEQTGEMPHEIFPSSKLKKQLNESPKLGRMMDTSLCRGEYRLSWIQEST
jgi:hypothetical protein